MIYNLLLGKEELGLVLSELENKADDILVMMDEFNKLWNDIYQSYEYGNFEKPKAFGRLVISIHKDWKDKSNIIRQIEECLGYILHQLEKVKEHRVLTGCKFAGIDQEAQYLSNSLKKFEIDKNTIGHLTRECQKSKQQENCSVKWVLLKPLYKITRSSNLNVIDKYIGLAIVTSAIPYNYCAKKARRQAFNIKLSRLFESSIEMNTKLRDFGLFVSAKIGTAALNTHRNQKKNHYNAALNNRINGLIKVTQKLWDCFRDVQDQTSQNENNAGNMIPKPISRFLMNNT
ncbi:hypothetical protein MFLAVUS_004939 [Mucor flavus]|uniref:Uncharacterized protein n=1 Tax=Mucor flavus TaxID=439312 RepID=A0ABP9YXD7_9FUNG